MGTKTEKNTHTKKKKTTTKGAKTNGAENRGGVV